MRGTPSPILPTRPRALAVAVVVDVVLVLVLTGVYLTTNAGHHPRGGSFDAAVAPAFAIGTYAFLLTIVIIMFDKVDFDPKPPPQQAGLPDPQSLAGERKRWNSHEPRVKRDVTSFVRRHWLIVFSVGPLFAATALGIVVLWHTFATHPGALGTVWGDIGHSPVAMLALLLGFCATVHCGFLFASLAEALRHDHAGPSIVFFVFMFLTGLASGAVHAVLYALVPTIVAAGISAVGFLIVTAGFVIARRWAITRCARVEAEASRHARLAEAAAVAERIRHDITRTPPRDFLMPGEDLLLFYDGGSGPPPRWIIATSRRIVLAAPAGPGKTQVFREYPPAQLVSAFTEPTGNGTRTIVQFRDHGDWVLTVADAFTSRQFTNDLSHLARTGELPMRECEQFAPGTLWRGRIEQ